MNTQQMTMEDALQHAVQAHQNGNLAMAEHVYRQILHYQPDHAAALQLLGVVAYQLEQYGPAADYIRKALAVQPDYPEAHCNLGSVLQKLGRLEEARQHFLTAIRLDPSSAEAHCNLGNLLCELGLQEEAIEAFSKAITLQPNYLAAHLNMGTAYADMNKLGSAISCYKKVIAMDPAHAEALNNLGAALNEMGNADDAKFYFEEALKHDPNHAPAWSNLGATLLERGLKEEAMACFAKAPGHEINFSVPMSNYIFGLHYLSDHTAASVHKEALAWAKEFAPLSLMLPPANNVRDPNKRIKVGYLGGDFKSHPVGYFIEKLYSHHDKSQVEIYSYPNQKASDELTQRLRNYSDHWFPVLKMNDDQVAEKIRSDGVDILFDLSGHTSHNRLLVFARKPAPVQVTWLGYFGTTGMKQMDYILCDGTIIEPGEEQYYVEKAFRMPEIYICFSPPPYDIEVGPLPALTKGHITFGCFNKITKIAPEVFDWWAEVMRQVPDSRMFFKSRAFESAEVRARVEGEFARRDIVKERLLMELHSPREEFLRKYNDVDLVLDTFPYAGGTTTAEALWMGVPVVAKRGESFVGRIGPTILNHSGMGHLVCSDKNEYVSKAVELVSDLNALAEIRKSLRPQFLASPVCDGPRFARHFEAALRIMWKNWCEGSGI